MRDEQQIGWTGEQHRMDGYCGRVTVRVASEPATAVAASGVVPGATAPVAPPAGLALRVAPASQPIRRVRRVAPRPQQMAAGEPDGRRESQAA
jgi:hypothetical protein